MHRYFGEIRPVMPSRLEMRTTGEEHQQGRSWCLINQQIVTTQVGEDPDAIGLYCIAEEGIKGLPSKASLMASKTFLAFLRAVEI